MTEIEKQRIDQAANEYGKNGDFSQWSQIHSRIRESLYQKTIRNFKAGAEYENPIAYEAGFQDGFKKQDNEMWNAAIEEVAKIVWQHRKDRKPIIAEIVGEIQKLKK